MIKGLSKLVSAYFVLLKFLLGMMLMIFAQLVYGNLNEKGDAEKHLELTPVTVQLNWSHQYEFAGFYAALAKGYYADAGLDVSLLKWQPGHEPLQSVLEGHADFGVGYSTLVVDYVKGAPIEVLSTSFQYSPMILLSKTPIMTLEDLKNKRAMTHDDMQIEALLSLAYQAQVHEIQVVKSSGDLNAFINDEVDLYAAYATNEPYRLDKMSIAYYPVDPKNYGIQSYGNLLFTSRALARKPPNLARRFNEATLKGWEYALYNQSEIVDYILAKFPVIKTREELLHEAKETVKYVKFGTTPIGQVDIAKLQAIAVNAAETGLISEAALKQADISKLLFRDKTGFLTLEELNYLQQHPVIPLANDNAWAPFEFTDEEARYQGVAADYFKLFEQKLGVRFEATANQNWESALQRAYTGELPVLPCAVSSAKRQAHLNFTKPYLSSPMVFLARDNVSYIDDYSKLNRKIVAVTRGYWSQEYLEEHYPKISLLLVNSVHKGWMP